MEERANRSFGILMDGVRVGEQRIERHRRSALKAFRRRIPDPAALVKNNSR
jgi:hypothetical protein